MKRLNSWVGLSAVLALSLSAVAPASAATITLGPNLLATPVSLAARASCAQASSDATIDDPFFEMPTIAREQGVSGVTTIRIQLSSSGSLIASALESSSGNNVLDDAAIRTSHVSHYSPEVANCERVPGEYLMTVNFAS